MAKHHFLAITIVLSLLATGSASGFERAYLGAWTREPGRCDFSGFGPFRITRGGLEEHESFCRTRHARRDATGWSVRLSCAAEGDTTDVDLHWQILPNGHLREVSKEGTKDYVRCP